MTAYRFKVAVNYPFMVKHLQAFEDGSREATDCGLAEALLLVSNGLIEVNSVTKGKNKKTNMF